MSKALKKLIDINRLREFKNKLVGAGSAYVQTAAVDQTVAGTKTFSKPIVGSVTGSSGSCTGNAATATEATQDSAGNQINTTYSKNGHTHDDRYYTETEVNNLLGGKANTSGTYSNLTVGNAGSATNATYANWLRTSSHSDHLFHTEWDNAGYFWTYVTAGDGGYRAVRVARSDSAANADHATSADSATKAIILKSNSSAYHEIRFDWSRQVNGRVGIRVDAVDLGGIATTSGTYGGMTVGSATRATQDSDGHQISTTYIKRTDAVSYNIGACFTGFYSSASHISNIGNGGRLAVGATTSASNLYDTITTTNSNTVVCSRNITLAGVWKLISIIKHNVFSENYAIVESTHQAGSSFAAGVVAVQGLFVRVS